MAQRPLPAINQRPEADRAPATSATRPRPVAVSLLRSLRPSQWTKNLIVFAALLFGERGDAPAFLDPTAIGRAMGAFRSSARCRAWST